MYVTFLKNKPDDASISPKNRWIKICERLLGSDDEAVKIEFETSKKAGCAYRSALSCIEIHGYPLQPRKNGNDVYILKKDDKEQIDE